MKFESYNIPEVIKKSLDELGFKRPTDIQFKAIQPILNKEDVLAIAQTGSGKTAAFAIPVLSRLHQLKIQRNKEGIKCLVMVPTRELSLQIEEVFNLIGKYSKVKTICVHGGVEQDPQIARLEKGADILVATPGRMFDLIKQGYINLENIEILILDEADRMFEKGFVKDIYDVKKFIHNPHQTLFFSATINKKVKELAYDLVRNAIRIQISPKDFVSKNIDHSVLFVKMDDKRFFLERFVKENPDSKILVFVRTKIRSERVQEAMKRAGIESIALHGDKDQKERIRVLKAFKDGHVKLLIATDVTARGIDIPDVALVINYDLPEQAENYVHRVGRTGRGTKRGRAISLCSDDEKKHLSAIEDFLGQSLKVLEISSREYNDTLNTTEDHNSNWKQLMKKAEEDSKKKNRKK
ncbi:MAG: DEAD/DEAH box helicase [Cytophagaceae bacterium]